MVESCEEILVKIKKYWTQYHLDGFHNVWIMKPGAKSRGRGRYIVIVFGDSGRSRRGAEGTHALQITPDA